MAKTRVLHAEDSVVVRSIIARILKEDDSIEVLDAAKDGLQAIDLYKKNKPDIVLMDIEMPNMDGIDALKEIIAFDKGAKVIMCSTLTTKNAEIALRAMRYGAVDYIAKPTNKGEVGTSSEFKTDLIRLIKNIAPKALQDSHTGKIYKNAVALRPAPPLHWKAKVVAVGSSTGGPQALFDFIQGIEGLKVPIVITQHMPAAFTTLLAKHISTQTAFECLEAEDGMELKAGRAILARGGKHMLFEKNATGQMVVKLDDGEQENFCKPAVDPMYRSLVDHLKGQVMSVVLTGMGHDGQDGAQAIIDAGGYCVAQDEETSVVWGMPGAVATNGLCSAVLPLKNIAQWVKDHI